MSNMNTVAGFQNFSQVIGVAGPIMLTVPSSGVYAGFPSPLLYAGAAMDVSAPPDIVGSDFDGHPFILRMSGAVTTGASSTVQLIFYQVPNVSVGVIGSGSTAAITSAGAPGSAAATFVSLAASGAVGTTTANFIFEVMCMWDSVSKKLTAVTTAVSQLPGGTTVTPTASTISSVGLNDLNFAASVTWGTANAANSILVREFSIDRR